MLTIWNTAGAAQTVNCKKEMKRLTVTGIVTKVDETRVNINNGRYFVVIELKSGKPCSLDSLAIESAKTFSVACKVGTTAKVTGEYESVEMVGWMLTARPEDLQCQ